jgi:hypothetical protein
VHVPFSPAPTLALSTSSEHVRGTMRAGFERERKLATAVRRTRKRTQASP